jgi:hypothetical protein
MGVTIAGRRPDSAGFEVQGECAEPPYDAADRDDD